MLRCPRRTSARVRWLHVILEIRNKICPFYLFRFRMSGLDLQDHRNLSMLLLVILARLESSLFELRDRIPVCSSVGSETELPSATSEGENARMRNNELVWYQVCTMCRPYWTCTCFYFKSQCQFIRERLQAEAVVMIKRNAPYGRCFLFIVNPSQVNGRVIKWGPWAHFGLVAAFWRETVGGEGRGGCWTVGAPTASAGMVSVSLAPAWQQARRQVVGRSWGA